MNGRLSTPAAFPAEPLKSSITQKACVPTATQNNTARGEDTVRPAWRHADLTRNESGPIRLGNNSEKGLAGTSGSGNLDSGVGKRLLGTLLTYMAERKSDVFFFATANAVQFLPPELLRKGRWDELWFLSLPTVNERKAIFDIHLRKRNRDPKKFDLSKLAEASKLFTGSECEEAIVSAMYASFTDGKEIDTQAVVNACKTTVPLAKSMKEDIEAIEAWGKRRARPASSEEPTKGDDFCRLLAGDMDDLKEE